MSRVDHRGRHLDRIAEVRAGLAAEKVGYPIGIRETEVVRTAMVGAGLLRLTLGGPGAEGFEAHAPDEHVKLIFPDPDGTLRLPERNGAMLRWPRPAVVSREYTVRRYDPDAREIDIDIALHDGGLASDWAREARPGAVIHVAGPPGGLIVPHSYDRYLLAGDLTALPAIARWLEELPGTAKGWAFIEVVDTAQEIELSAPEGVEVRWLHRGDLPAGDGDALVRAVTGVTVPEGERLYVWVAGEAGQIKPLRRWVRDELRLEKADHDITGYWKRGVADFDEDDHH
ncbi:MULTISPECIES: siderophore-interacting protein [unclassified Streptomyces]|uniref:Siderophore-interacting protein n=1 Tax=Streptomyces flavovirens TaxID=52258 RepID=A0ABV8N4W8_9ACTN|nr:MULTISPECIES: siderophore-interacting protein [unclassified Streptomyces]MYR67696.1 SIP domain-containing protein [Streptomyces sp. SID4939]MYS00463.1 SIP domain-containing protein [Streptomyces sp. SID4940]MYT67967.1 SIP domain-containing protein [Streptomyces sp. SID8357]MYT86810.1 SIP domain-containing protein [Streptomyces sp. SID8360]MYU35891.1 SIP domain-containing protein [Streptomyces sp. SID8358]MYW41526.1 SIP domain-containing protein [Streptomyces sp. SID1]